MAAEGVLVNVGKIDSNYWCLESHLVNNTRRFSLGCPAAPSGSFQDVGGLLLLHIESTSCLLECHHFVAAGTSCPTGEKYFLLILMFPLTQLKMRKFL